MRAIREMNRTAVFAVFCAIIFVIGTVHLITKNMHNSEEHELIVIEKHQSQKASDNTPE